MPLSGNPAPCLNDLGELSSLRSLRPQSPRQPIRFVAFLSLALVQASWLSICCALFRSSPISHSISRLPCISWPCSGLVHSPPRCSLLSVAFASRIGQKV